MLTTTLMAIFSATPETAVSCGPGTKLDNGYCIPLVETCMDAQEYFEKSGCCPSDIATINTSLIYPIDSSPSASSNSAPSVSSSSSPSVSWSDSPSGSSSSGSCGSVTDDQKLAFYTKVDYSEDELMNCPSSTPPCQSSPGHMLPWFSKGLDNADMVVLSCILNEYRVLSPVPSVAYLGLHNNSIGDSGMSALASELGKGALPQLSMLRININQIGNAGLTSFATAAALGNLQSLTSLNLAGNLIEDEGLAALATALGNGDLPSLTLLYLVDNAFSAAAKTAFQVDVCDVISPTLECTL